MEFRRGVTLEYSFEQNYNIHLNRIIFTIDRRISLDYTYFRIFLFLVRASDV